MLSFVFQFVMDQKLHFMWKTVLHEFTEEKAVFRKMVLGPSSEKYIYAAAANQITKIKVANCGGGTLKECWEQQDPFCGWCTPKNSCSFKSECQNFNWVPMVEGPMQDTRQLISFKMLRTDTGVVAKITMHVNRNLTKNYYCQLSGKDNSLCESSFPQCTCKIENDTFLSQGLQVTVNINQSLNFSEILSLHDCRNVVKETSKTPCLDCIKAGCSWSGYDCSFATSETKVEKCPALLELNMTRPNEIAIRLDHPDELKSKNLMCVFNGKQTKAGVLNNGILMCELVNNNNISTSGALTSVNVLIGNSLIDNPQSLSVPSCYFTGQCKESGLNANITDLIPNEVSIAGKRQVIIKGKNFWGGNATKVQFTQFLSVTELQVESSTETEIKFALPKASKGNAEVCVKLPDGRCHGSARVTYRHKPSCGSIFPSTMWDSGGRYLNINGTSMNLVEEVIFENYTITLELLGRNVRFKTPKLTSQPSRLHSVKLVVVGEELICETNIRSYPDAEFQGFTTTAVGNQWQITIKKKSDQLGITKDDVIVDAIVNNKIYPCPVVEDIVNDTIICKTDASIGLSGLKVQIRLGNFSTVLEQPFNWLWLLLIIPFIFIFLIIGACCITRRKEKELSRKLSQQLELLENDIRNEIREGFAELQTEKSDLIEGSVVLPFLDYKHFANRIFFPEAGSNSRCFVNDICAPFQDTQELNTDEFSKALFDLLSNKLFLISLVHTLEAQKTFTIKDRCNFASCLTIALHSNLDYLTDVMKDLLRDLMDQSTNTQPKLMLRRTESVVEKLLTNWMSICLYGFLRESVGEPLFLLVSALSQRISKGPVDAITEKALYTLNEDWLLWQAQDFINLKLNVTFPASPGTEDITLDVNVLDCDTIEQGKEKILQIFKMKFGYFQQFQAKHIDIEYDNNGIYLRLQEIDQSSKALDNGTTVLNTFIHYKIPDGAKIRVTRRTNQPKISTQESIKDDSNYDKKYCHLIKADLEELEDQVNSAQKRKKVKLKEVYLTKLLSTKVAVHSFVENLFRTIWGTPNSKVPIAIKYFFDFLDRQGENKKITDPDVLHIWKTNSLPLRFWVNILKNPQFVFDMEKSAHLDGCLSVIAQAFMDCFSLTDQQLGKHAPTNKLLYAKDIPQFKEEVKAYYKQIRESPPLSDEDIKNFLMEESKKHENEFNVPAALGEIYKYISTHFTELLASMEEEEALQNIKGQLLHVRDLFEERKMIRWQ
uniref:Plexin C1 n=1 Tax=Erpetoichthys calabaricus TaxID=27687 RepID=A0A8C4S2J4_ERPCA